MKRRSRRRHTIGPLSSTASSEVAASLQRIRAIAAENRNRRLLQQLALLRSLTKEDRSPGAKEDVHGERTSDRTGRSELERGSGNDGVGARQLRALRRRGRYVLHADE